MLTTRRRLLALAPALLLPSAAKAASGPLIAAGRNQRANWDPYVLSRSVLKGWWSADDHGTARMTDDGAGLISAWVDRISGVTVTATTTARPTWASSSFNSAYAGLTFDGTANCLVSTTLSALPTGSTAGELWVIGSQNHDATGGPFYAAAYGTQTSGQQRALNARVLSSVLRLQVSDGGTNLSDTAYVLSGNFIAGGNWSGTTQGGRRNGTALTSVTIASLATGTTRLRIGANDSTAAISFWLGVIRHVIVTTLLGAADRQRLEGWLAWDAGLTSLLPASHPYKSVRP